MSSFAAGIISIPLLLKRLFYFTLPWSCALPLDSLTLMPESCPLPL
jgi:hypothetical protein